MKKLITATPFVGSFVALVTPTVPYGETDESKAKYQMTIALPKNDPFWKQVAAEIKATAQAKWTKVPAKLRSPVKDGDANLNDDGEIRYPEHEGCYTLQASSKRRPDVADASLNPILNPKELYSGAFYRAAVRAYAWEHPTGGKGVSFSLETVQKVKDGDPLGGGGGKAQDDFSAFKSDEASPEADGLLG